MAHNVNPSIHLSKKIETLTPLNNDKNIGIMSSGHKCLFLNLKLHNFIARYIFILKSKKETPLIPQPSCDLTGVHSHNDVTLKNGDVSLTCRVDGYSAVVDETVDVKWSKVSDGE